ncbi:MAG: DUF5680 domain-containing protein [Thermodesulfobacteriota bacterium]|nr:DUF5680 domain-containing protein [Thermodesulfobacteriota bacterium]
MTLIDFILKAKLSGYASGGEGQEKKFDDGSIGFEIVSDGYRYLDRYNGFNPFAGSEQIFVSNNALLWVMNYFGEILPSDSEPKKIYSFLKEAMLLISPEYPFRGPAKLENQNFRYENQQYGSLDRFHGIESIYENNKKVYILYYHGGRIQTIM